jgi:hypothetical protein
MYDVIAANSSLATAQGNRDIPGSNYNFNKFQFQPELQADTHTESK